MIATLTAPKQYLIPDSPKLSGKALSSRFPEYMPIILTN